MKQILKFIRRAIAVIGTFLVFSAISTSDYYLIELKQNEPGYIWTMMAVGFGLMLLAVICKIFETNK